MNSVELAATKYEQEIFNLVFFKPRNIGTNSNLNEGAQFADLVDFYKMLKEDISSNISFEQKNKLRKRIRNYIPGNSITLYLIKKEKHESSFNDDIKNYLSASTFTDEEYSYLVRLLNYKNSSRMFIFSRTETVLKNYKLLLLPMNESYLQYDNFAPLQINHCVEPEKIELSFI